jgi:hypothetical protein
MSTDYKDLIERLEHEAIGFAKDQSEHTERRFNDARKSLVDAIAALEAENFKLAAGQCVNATADDGGRPYCKKIAALVAERDKWREACASGWGEPTLINTLVAERDAAVADAERYRWLRENRVIENYDGEKCLYFWYDFEHYDDVDAAIDAAREPNP